MCLLWVGWVADSRFAIWGPFSTNGAVGWIEAIHMNLESERLSTASAVSGAPVSLVWMCVDLEYLPVMEQAHMAAFVPR